MHLASQIRVKHTPAGGSERILVANVDFDCEPHLASYTFQDLHGAAAGTVIIPRTLKVPHVAQWVARELERTTGGRVEVADSLRFAK